MLQWRFKFGSHFMLFEGYMVYMGDPPHFEVYMGDPPYIEVYMGDPPYRPEIPHTTPEIPHTTPRPR